MNCANVPLPGPPRAARAPAVSPGSSFRISPVRWERHWRASFLICRDKIRLGIDGLRALAQLEMDLRLIDITCGSGQCDHLAGRNMIAARDSDLVAMGIGGDETIVVADENKVSVGFEIAAGIADSSRGGRVHRRPTGSRNV